MTDSKKEKIRKAGYTAAQWTWGLPQTLTGSVMFLLHRKDEHFEYRGAKGTVWEGDAGVSLGRYIFVPRSKAQQRQSRPTPVGNPAANNIFASGSNSAADRSFASGSNSAADRSFASGSNSAADRSFASDSNSSPDNVPDGVSTFLLDHEYGHTIQSLILGPLYLPLIGLPSMVWNRLPYFARLRKETGRNYYSAIFERTANDLSRKTARKKKVQ